MSDREDCAYLLLTSFICSPHTITVVVAMSAQGRKSRVKYGCNILVNAGDLLLAQKAGGTGSHWPTKVARVTRPRRVSWQASPINRRT